MYNPNWIFYTPQSEFVKGVYVHNSVYIIIINMINNYVNYLRPFVKRYKTLQGKNDSVSQTRNIRVIKHDMFIQLVVNL